MTCFHPLKGYRSREVNPETGKHLITFNPVLRLVEGSHVMLPCGQCSGCRADRAFQWAMRIGHEAKVHEQSCFVTLTYDDQHVPQDFSVKLEDYQRFMKRCRKAYPGVKLRFAGCGEYGETTFRPHYHLALLGLDFADKKRFTMRGKYPVFTSERLRELWPFGLHEIGILNHESGGYVARYIFKKMTGNKADDYYLRVSPVDGQVHRVSSEFFTMSRRPGLGMGWFERFSSDAFPSDFVVIKGRKVRPPQFYLAKMDEEFQTAIKRRRKAFSVKPEQRWNNTAERLAVREECHDARMKLLVRSL